MRGAGITYEVALEPEPEILSEFEAWLEDHVDAMLRLPGFTGASIHKARDPDSGNPLRVVRYGLTDQAALDRYLAEEAPRMRAEGMARFGGRFRASRRVVEEGRDAALTDARPCPNCSELLWGQYCANCGQRSRVRMITFWELLRDAGELLATLDSRLWKTIGLLVFRPGRLTIDYLQGKRARYVPPMRLFIASTLVFFFIATLNTRFDFGPEGAIIIGPGSGAQTDDEESAANREPALEILRRALEEAEREAGSGGDPEAAAAIERARRAIEGAGTEGAQPGEGPQMRTGVVSDTRGINVDENCNVDFSGVPEWLPKILSAERAAEVCLRIKADHGRSFIQAMMSNIPAMMFLFLPLMAAVMKLLYPLSGRYYAEHLLFLVHYHSFFFVLNIGLIAVRWGVEVAIPNQIPLTALTVAAFVYLPVYLFRAMQRVYAQGFWATAFKYVSLGMAYFIALLITFMGLLVYTAVTL
jgi:hypothetical protein